MIFKYLNVGILNSIVGLAIIIICLDVFNVNYHLSYFIGYLVGLIVSFILNKSYTFQSKNSWEKEILPFVGVFLISYIMSHGVLFITVEYLSIHQNIAIVFSMIAYTIIGFYLNKKLFLKGKRFDH